MARTLLFGGFPSRILPSQGRRQKLTFPVGNQGEAWGLALPIRCTSASAVQVQTCRICFLGRMAVECGPQGRVPASLVLVG